MGYKSVTDNLNNEIELEQVNSVVDEIDIDIKSNDNEETLDFAEQDTATKNDDRVNSTQEDPSQNHENDAVLLDSYTDFKMSNSKRSSSTFSALAQKASEHIQTGLTKLPPSLIALVLQPAFFQFLTFKTIFKVISLTLALIPSTKAVLSNSDSVFFTIITSPVQTLGSPFVVSALFILGHNLTRVSKSAISGRVIAMVVFFRFVISPLFQIGLITLGDYIGVLPNDKILKWYI